MVTDRLSRRRPLRALFLLSGLVGAVALLTAALSAPAGAAAQTEMIIGLDMQPQDNTARTVSRVQTCTKVAVGDTFQADVWVQGVQKLVAWELRVDYDNSIVNLESADFNQFLLSTSPSGSIFPSLFEQEKPGRYFLAAAEVNGTPDSGSGVLARLSLKAVGKGLANVSIASNPAYLGPRLTAAGGGTIGDVNGDGIWDQSFVNGQVAVDADCGSGPPPVITPAPAPGGATPPPHDTQGPPGAAGGDVRSGGNAGGDVRSGGDAGGSVQGVASHQIVIEDGNGEVVLKPGRDDPRSGQPGQNAAAPDSGSSAFPSTALIAIFAYAVAVGAAGTVSLAAFRRRRGLQTADIRGLAARA